MAGNEASLKTVNGWMLEHVCHVAWEKFYSTKLMSAGYKDLIQGCLAELIDTELNKEIIYLMIIICRLSDGEDYEIQYAENSELTVLEDMIPIFQQLATFQKKELRTEGHQLIPTIKAEAVYVCCRDDDFSLADHVFKRVWTKEETKEPVYKRAKEVLDSGQKEHKHLKKATYTGFLNTVLEYLDKIVKGLEAPTLLQAAERISSCEEWQQNGNHSNKAGKRSPLKLKTLMQAKPGDCGDNEHSSPATRTRLLSQEPLQELFRKTADGPAPNAAVNSDRSTFKVPASTTKSPLHKKRSAAESFEDYRLKRGVNRPDRHVPLNGVSSTSDVDDDDTRSDITSISLSTTISRARKKWTEEEMEDFLVAVEMYGVGRWGAIKDHLSTSRTGVDLKDKWRNMVRKGDDVRLRKKRQKRN